jgi:hypothetical protein
MKSYALTEELGASSGGTAVAGALEVTRVGPPFDARPAVADPEPAPTESLLTIEAAAACLSTTATALRARCRRHARRVGREVLARLGAGVTAYKFGASWRVRIDPP